MSSKVKCDVCGKEYKNVKEHKTKTHNQRTLIVRNYDTKYETLVFLCNGEERELNCTGDGNDDDETYMIYDADIDDINEIYVYRNKRIEFMRFKSHADGDVTEEKVYKHNINIIFE